MHTTEPADTPADDLDAAPLGDAETCWPLGPAEGLVAPAEDVPAPRPRFGPASPLSFVALPEPGSFEARDEPAPATARLHFVPVGALGEAAGEGGATVIPLRGAGWSVRESSRSGRSRPEIELAATAPEAPAGAPRRRRRTGRLVLWGVVLVIVAGSMAVAGHLVERRTGATLPPPAASAAQAAGVAHAAPPPAGPGPLRPPGAATSTATPAPSPTPQAAAIPAAAPTPRATAAPTPAPRPTPHATSAPAPSPTPSPAPKPTPTPTPTPTPSPVLSWYFSGSTGHTNTCPGGALAFGGCTSTIPVERAGTLRAVVGGFTSSTLKLKIRDAAGNTLGALLVEPGHASLSVIVPAGTYRVTVQETDTQITSAFTLAVSLS